MILILLIPKCRSLYGFVAFRCLRLGLVADMAFHLLLLEFVSGAPPQLLRPQILCLSRIRLPHQRPRPTPISPHAGPPLQHAPAWPASPPQSSQNPFSEKPSQIATNDLTLTSLLGLPPAILPLDRLSFVQINASSLTSLFHRNFAVRTGLWEAGFDSSRLL